MFILRFFIIFQVKMRPIFCGNLDFDTRQSDVERLFRRYGRIDKIDMKSGTISPTKIMEKDKNSF